MNTSLHVAERKGDCFLLGFSSITAYILLYILMTYILIYPQEKLSEGKSNSSPLFKTNGTGKKKEKKKNKNQPTTTTDIILTSDGSFPWHFARQLEFAMYFLHLQQRSTSVSLLFISTSDSSALFVYLKRPQKCTIQSPVKITYGFVLQPQSLSVISSRWTRPILCL